MYFLRGFSFSTGWYNIWHVVRDFLSLLRSQIMWRQCVMFVWKAMTIVLFFITVLFFIVCIIVNWLVMLMNAFLNCCPGHGWRTRNIQSRYKIFLNQIFSSCFREKSSTMHLLCNLVGFICFKIVKALKASFFRTFAFETPTCECFVTHTLGWCPVVS